LLQSGCAQSTVLATVLSTLLATVAAWLPNVFHAPPQSTNVPAMQDRPGDGPRPLGETGPMTLDEITEKMRERVGADSGLGATVKFDFGEDGVIYVDGASTPNTVSNEDKDAECTIRISKENFLKLTQGELDPTTAFMMGKLKVEGNMGIAMKLQSVFS